MRIKTRIKILKRVKEAITNDVTVEDLLNILIDEQEYMQKYGGYLVLLLLMLASIILGFIIGVVK